MTNKPDVGKNVYKDALRRGRIKTQEAREALRRIVEESPGPQTTAMLITRVALALGSIEAIWTEFDDIGRTAKNLK